MTQINFEYTDTFCGEANYSWVRKGSHNFKEGEEVSDTKAIRYVKKYLGLTGTCCKKVNMGDSIALYPSGSCTVVFIDFHYFGSCGRC